MNDNIYIETDKSMADKKVTESINLMLECLLNRDDKSCKKCNNCEKVDACCFLMESVVVSRYIEKSKSNSPE
jgi:hypothetical protein